MSDNGKNYVVPTNVKLLPFRPKIYASATVTKTPLRFTFSSGTLASDDKLTFNYGAAAYALSGTLKCWVRRAESNGSYTETGITCTQASTTVTLTQPQGFAWQANKNYEIVMASTDYSQFGASNNSGVLSYKFSIKNNANADQFYQQGLNPHFQQTNAPILTEYYYSVNIKDTQSYLFFKFTLPGG